MFKIPHNNSSSYPKLEFNFIFTFFPLSPFENIYCELTTWTSEMRFDNPWVKLKRSSHMKKHS